MTTGSAEQTGLDQSLQGLTVLEFPGLAASFCGFILRVHGATVTKVEPSDGDPQRNEAPAIHSATGEQTSAAFLAYSRGKDSVFLDLETITGRHEFERLARGADVVITAPGTHAGSACLDYEDLKAINPGIILTSISPFGTSGPYAGYTGGDLVASAMSGLLHLTGEPDGQPVRMGGQQALKLGGAEAAAGTMVALFRRDSTGVGQHVDVAVRDAMIKATVNAIPRYEYEGIVQNRVGDHWGVRDKPLRALWRCSDGWVSFVRRGGALGGRVNQQCVAWMAEAGIDVTGMESVQWDLMDLGNPEHREILDRLDELFETFLAQRPTEEVFTEGLRRGMTLAPVRRIPEVLAEKHLEQRKFWSTVGSAQGPLRVPGRFVKIGDQAPLTLDPPTGLAEKSSNFKAQMEAGSRV